MIYYHLFLNDFRFYNPKMSKLESKQEGEERNTQKIKLKMKLF